MGGFYLPSVTGHCCIVATLLAIADAVVGAANTNDHAIRPGINFVVSGTEGDSSFGQLSKGAMYKRFDTNTRAAARATRSCPRLPHVAGRGWSDQRALSLERPFSRNAAAFSMCAAANAACARARGQSSAETAS